MTNLPHHSRLHHRTPVIIVHGGAWAIPDATVEATEASVRRAASIGHALLTQSQSALDAVEAAVCHLEQDPLFDAGIGSCLTETGTVEMDAAVMYDDFPHGLRSGAVACLSNSIHPISVARGVMEQTQHCLLVGRGADTFSNHLGLGGASSEQLVSSDALKEWKNLRRFGNAVQALFNGHDTVGAVAMDVHGNLASATSTGGITGKKLGRVGDSPIFGSGLFCDKSVGACSTTGHGESIMQVCLARNALALVELRNLSPEQACKNALQKMEQKTGGCGGIIMVDAKGNVSHACTTKRSSLGAIFINKTCLTGYHFRYPLTLVLCQMIFAISMLSALHVLGLKKLRQARNDEFGVLALPTALFTCNVVVGLSALSLVNIPMFSAFRRLTLLFVMVAEYVMLKKTHSRGIMNCVVVMTIGAFVSAVDDVSFSSVGYCLVLLNNVLTAGYLACIKRAMRDTEFDALALLYYIAVLGLPFVAMLVLATGELAHVMAAFRTQPELSTWGFGISIILTASGAFLVNFSTSLCTHVTSPLTTSVAGQVKNVAQTILGFFSWGFVPTTMNTVGLLVALGAQIWFGYLKYCENCGGVGEEDNGKMDEKGKGQGDEDAKLLCCEKGDGSSGRSSSESRP
ncbi:unnamed protein product [Agarophyton chilense]